MLLSLIIVLKTFGLNYVLNITLELKRVSMCQTKIALKFCFLKMVQITKKKGRGGSIAQHIFARSPELLMGVLGILFT